jgi:hypothetical protein
MTSATPQKPDLMRTFFVAAHALLTQRTGSSYGSKAPVAAAESLQTLEVLESWAMNMGGFNPMAPVNAAGFPMIQALLRSDKVLPLEWLTNWTDRHGSQTVFGGVGDTDQMLSFWMENRVMPDVLKSSSLNVEELGVASWLVHNAPEHHWNARQAGCWLDALRAMTNQNYAKTVTALIEELEARGASPGADATRPASRWAVRDNLRKEEDQKIDGSLLVACSSGAMRTLDQLWSLRGVTDLSSREVSLAKLPALPHGRRDELVRKWILEPDLNIEETRSRLWAGIHLKEEIFYAFRERSAWHSDRNDDATVRRCDRAITQRDPYGRSLLANLTISQTPELRRLGQALVNGELAKPEDLYDAQGRGLIQQCLHAQSTNLSGDPFSSPSSPQAKDRTPEVVAAWIGPEETHQEWSDVLIDMLLPGNRYSDSSMPKFAVEILPQGDPRAKLEQALVFARFNSEITSACNAGIYDRTGSRNNHSIPNQRFMESVTNLSKLLKSGPLLLDIGQEEWRQWGLLGRDKVLVAGHKPAWLNDGNITALRELDALVISRALECDMLRLTDVAPSRRASPRL